MFFPTVGIYTDNGKQKNFRIPFRIRLPNSLAFIIDNNQAELAGPDTPSGERKPVSQLSSYTSEGLAGLDQSKPADASVRAAEKQASRNEDDRRLASGEVTRAQLWQENSFLRAAGTQIDFSRIPSLK
jgi:hypothetical protein